MTSPFGKPAKVDPASFGVTPPARFLDLMLMTTRMLDAEAEQLRTGLRGENSDRREMATSLPPVTSEITTTTSDLTADMMIKAMQVAEVRKLRRENDLETIEIEDFDRQVTGEEVSVGQASQPVSMFMEAERDREGDSPQADAMEELSLATRLRLMNALEALAQLNSGSQEEDSGDKMTAPAVSSRKVSDPDDGAGDAEEDGGLLVLMEEDDMMPDGVNTEVELIQNTSNPTVPPPTEVKDMVKMMHGVLPEFENTVENIREMFTSNMTESQNSSSREGDRLLRVFHRVNGNTTENAKEQEKLLEVKITNSPITLSPSKMIQKISKQLSAMSPESSNDVVVLSKEALRIRNDKLEKLVAAMETQLMKPNRIGDMEPTTENKPGKLRLSDMLNGAVETRTDSSMRLMFSATPGKDNTMNSTTTPRTSLGNSVDDDPLNSAAMDSNTTPLPSSNVGTLTTKALQNNFMTDQNTAELLSSIPLAVVVKLEQIPTVMAAIMSIMNREMTATPTVTLTDSSSVNAASPSPSTPAHKTPNSSAPPESTALSELLRRVQQEMQRGRGEEVRESKTGDEESEVFGQESSSNRPLFERLRRPETTTRPPEPGQERQRLGTTLADVLRRITLRPNISEHTTSMSDPRKRTVTRSFIRRPITALPFTRKRTVQRIRTKARPVTGRNSTRNETRTKPVARAMTTVRFPTRAQPVMQALTPRRTVFRRQTTVRSPMRKPTTTRDVAQLLSNSSNEAVPIMSAQRAQALELLRIPKGSPAGTSEPPLMMQNVVMRDIENPFPPRRPISGIKGQLKMQDALRASMDTSQRSTTERLPNMNKQPPTQTNSRLAALLSQLTASRRDEQKSQRALDENGALGNASVSRTLPASRNATLASVKAPVFLVPAVQRLKVMGVNHVPPTRNAVVQDKRASGIPKGANEKVISLSEQLRLRILKGLSAQEKLEEMDSMQMSSTTPRVSIVTPPSKPSGTGNELSSKQKLLARWKDQLRKQATMKLLLKDLPDDMMIPPRPAMPITKGSLQLADTQRKSRSQLQREVLKQNVLEQMAKNEPFKDVKDFVRIVEPSASVPSSTTEQGLTEKYELSLGDRLISLLNQERGLLNQTRENQELPQRFMTMALPSPSRIKVDEIEMVSSTTHIPLTSGSHTSQLSIPIPKSSIRGEPLASVMESMSRTPTSHNPFPDETVHSVLQRLTIPHRAPAKIIAPSNVPSGIAKVPSEQKQGLLDKWRQVLTIRASDGDMSSELISSMKSRGDDANSVSQAPGDNTVKDSRPSAPSLGKDPFSSRPRKSTTVRSPLWPAKDDISGTSLPRDRFRSPPHRTTPKMPAFRRRPPPRSSPLYISTLHEADNEDEEAEADAVSAADDNDLSSADTERREWVWNWSPRRPVAAARPGWRWLAPSAPLLPSQYTAEDHLPSAVRARPEPAGRHSSGPPSSSRTPRGQSAISGRSDGVGVSPVLSSQSRHQQYHILDRPYDFTDRSPDRAYPVVYIQGFG